jgi:hypothetical protein
MNISEASTECVWLSRPFGTRSRALLYPAFKRRAILDCPFGTRCRRDAGAPRRMARDSRMRPRVFHTDNVSSPFAASESEIHSTVHS